MAINKYYVSAKYKELDLGMEIEDINAYMAAINFLKVALDSIDFELEEVLITDVELLMEVVDAK
ncbi:TPA: hypothetical protein ACGO2M_000788 [Streptococcus suis]